MSLTKIASCPPLSDKLWHAAAHPSLPLLAVASSDRTVRIYSLTSYTLLSTIEGGHKRSIRSVAWKPNTIGESVLATASFDSTAGIWRRDEAANDEDKMEVEITGDSDHDDDNDEEDDEWRFAVVLDGHDSEVKSVAWSAGGTFLATCSRDKSVWIWEEMEDDNFETIAVLQDHTQDVKCVTWHPEEELLASGSYDDTIRLYREDVDDWVTCAVLEGHTSTVWSLSWEHNGSKSRLVSGSDDATCRVWKRVPRLRPESGLQKAPSILRQVESVEEDWEQESVLPRIHDRTVYSVDWSATSGRIVSAGGDGRVVVYEEKEGAWQVIAEFRGAHGVYEVNSVLWCRRRDKGVRTAGEEVIVTTGDDGGVNVFELNT